MLFKTRSPYLPDRLTKLTIDYIFATRESIRFLNEKKVRVVGIDYISLADVRSMEEIDFVHQTLLKNNIYISSADAAIRLGISQGTIQRWYKWGILTGKHDGGQSRLWIKWSGDLEDRLAGGARPDARMVTLRRLCLTWNKRPDDIISWAIQQGHKIFRLRRGRSMKYYILPNESSLQL